MPPPMWSRYTLCDMSALSRCLVPSGEEHPQVRGSPHVPPRSLASGTTWYRHSRGEPSMSTSPRLCSRCQSAPRLPRQRWCRQCLTSAQRQRRWAARQEAQVDDAFAPVTHAALQARPRGTQAPVPVLPEVEQGRTDTFQPVLSFDVVQVARTSAGVTQAQRQALLAYRIAVQEYEARRQIDRGWMPMDRSTMLVPLWQKVEEARRRCLALGVDPERDRR